MARSTIPICSWTSSDLVGAFHRIRTPVLRAANSAPACSASQNIVDVVRGMTAITFERVRHDGRNVATAARQRSNFVFDDLLNLIMN
jgi:hypothetical protein